MLLASARPRPTVPRDDPKPRAFLRQLAACLDRAKGSARPPRKASALIGSRVAASGAAVAVDVVRGAIAHSARPDGRGGIAEVEVKSCGVDVPERGDLRVARPA